MNFAKAIKKLCFYEQVEEYHVIAIYWRCFCCFYTSLFRASSTRMILVSCFVQRRFNAPSNRSKAHAASISGFLTHRGKLVGAKHKPDKVSDYPENSGIWLNNTQSSSSSRRLGFLCLAFIGQTLNAEERSLCGEYVCSAIVFLSAFASLLSFKLGNRISFESCTSIQ